MMAAVMGTFLVIILIIVMVLLISCVKIVRQAQALVIERLGAYQATWGTGLHFKLPIVDRVARRVDMKEYFTRLQIRRCSVMEWRIRSWRSRT